MPREDTQFKKGWKGGPGRPKGSVSAKTRVLRMIDELIAEDDEGIKGKEAKRALRKKFRQMFDRNPAGFVMKILAPLSPKAVELSSPEDKAPVRISLSEKPTSNVAGPWTASTEAPEKAD